MIYQLCNTGSENNIDAFYKIAVIEASQLPYFSHLSTDEKVKDIVTNLPDTAQAFTADLLHNNAKITHGTRLSSQGKLYPTTISFVLTPQDKALQAILEEFNNKEMVVLVSKHGTSHLYGTASQPLIFKYDELNNPLPGSLKGYTITITGSGYGESRIIDAVDLNIYVSGLAFELAGEI